MNHSSSPERPSDVPNRPKRRKVAVACDDCRARKVRCDGVQPVCGPCSKRSDQGVQCVYTGEPEKKRAVQSYITSLEDRIRHLESPGRSPGNAMQMTPGQTSQLKASNGRPSPGWDLQDLTPSQTVSHHGRENVGPSQGRDETLRPFHRPQWTNANRPQAQNMHPEKHATERVDGVNAMMGAVEEERPTHGFFGSSSAASFMRQIKTAVDERVSSPHHHTSGSILGMTPPSSLLSVQKEKPSTIPNYVLPPRKTADSLMDVYWTLVFPLYPLVDSVQMRAEYARVWTGESLQFDENMLMCILNVIFALACQLADFIRPEEREASADAFFSRAKDLLHFNLWNTGSAGLIQCLLLMAQYLQSTDSAHQCWIVTGLAIRNAQSLGLHLPGTIARLPSFQEQQLARKIWHGCVLMDRVISMTFGRPAMISKASCGPVPLPATVDEEYIPAASGAEVSQPANRPSMMAFYAKSLELYEILNDILLSLYKPVSDENPEDIHDFYFNKEGSEGERTIFDLDRSLTRWSRSLPSYLRGDTNDEVFLRQSVVLRARFLHVRMLLFRPALSKYCTSRDTANPDPLITLEDSLPQRVALQCSIICVKVAQEVIELVYRNIPTEGSSDFLPAWWYNILCKRTSVPEKCPVLIRADVYTAATVLIAGHLRPTILAEVTPAEITRSWNCALEILKKYESYRRSARRCVAALEILYERVVSGGAATDQVPANSQLVGVANAPNDLSWGEGINASLFDSLDMADFQDMSWLNSVPSNLY